MESIMVEVASDQQRKNGRRERDGGCSITMNDDDERTGLLFSSLVWLEREVSGA